VDASKGTCSCNVDQQYFLANPEAQRVLLLHGYEVDIAGGLNPRLVRGSSASGDKKTEGAPGDMKATEGQLITRIQSSSGEPCQVGGRSDWTEADARAGIGGELSEWLACAGLTLDTDPRSITPADAFPPHLRTMGLTLQLRLDYRNSKTDDFGQVDCFLTVVAMVTWTRRQRADLITAPGPGVDSQETLRKTIYGVSIELNVKGKFWTYAFADAVSFFVQCLVILQLPLFVVEFVALYCLGILSEIYRNAKRSQLNVYKHFHSAMARMMIAEVGFRGLMGGAWHGSVLKLHLTEQGVLEHLTDVFGDQISAGTLQMGELQRMVAVTFRHIDADGTGSVTCGEFIHSFMSGELITVPTMARYFDDDIKVGPLRVLLDSNWHERKQDVMQWKAANQAKEEKLTPHPEGSPESSENGPSREISRQSVQSEEMPAKIANDAEVNDSGLNDRHPVGFDAVMQRLEALEALNLEHRLGQLEADEILRREDSLRITRQEEDEVDLKAALTALIGRVDELDLAMVGVRHEVWRGLDNEAMAMRRDRSRESKFDSREALAAMRREKSRESKLDPRDDSTLQPVGSFGSRGSKRTYQWSSTAASSASFGFPPTDRRLQRALEEAPPLWDVAHEKEMAAVVPRPSTRGWHGIPPTGNPSRENTAVSGVSDSCLSKELRENTGGTYTSSYSNPWRSAAEVLRQMKGEV